MTTTTNRGRTKVSRAVAVIASALSSAFAAGAAVSYTGPDGGNWSDPANWSGGTVPVNGDDVTLPAPLTSYTVNYDGSYTAPGLYRLTINGSALGSPSTTLLQAGSALVANNEHIGYNLGPAIHTQTGGSNDLAVSLYVGDITNSNGTYNLGGTASLTVSSAVFIGREGTGTFNQTGGSNTVGSTGPILGLYLGEFHGAIGTYNLSGGTLTVSGGPELIAIFGTGSFVQTGGTHTVAGPLQVGAGTGSGTYNLQGGSLTAATVLLDAGGTFNQTGGTLNATNFHQNGGSLAGTLQNQGTFTYDAGIFSGRLVNQGAVTFNADFTADNGIENDTTIAIPASRRVFVSGAGFDNEGTLTLSGGSLGGAGPLVNNALLTGFGTIAGTGGFTNNLTINQGAGMLFLLNSGTNTNAGTINLSPGYPFKIGSALTNNGTLNLNGDVLAGAGTLANSPVGTIAGYGAINTTGFSNAGTLLAQGGTLNTAAFTNSGAVQITPGATIAGGTITNTGALRGAGTALNAVNSTGTIEPVGGTLLLQGALSNTGAGAINVTLGNQLVVTGLATNSAAINLEGGVLDTAGRAFNNTGTIIGYGTLRTGGLTNSGSALFSGGSASIAGDVTNAAGQTLAVKYTPAIFTGNVTNNGTIHVTKTTVTFAGAYTENGTYISDPSDNYFTDLTVSPSGTLTAGAGDRFVVSGNFSNGSTQSGAWNTSAAQLIFQGGTTHQMSVAGSIGSFGWGMLSVPAGQSLTLTGNSATAAATSNDGTLAQTAGASSLGALGGAGTVSVGNASGSAAVMNVASFHQNSVNVNATGTLAVAAHSPGAINTTGALTIAAGGTLDLSNNSLQINYGGGPSPIAAVRAQLTSGYAGGAWNGPGIDTSAADASHELGYADSADGVVKNLPPSTVLVKYTATGDADLDGKVDFNDLVILARHYNQSNANWDQGDFNYDGTVGFDDLVSLARNYGKGLSASQLAGFDPAFRADVERTFPGVPEPSGLGVTMLAAATLVRRRRRSSKCTAGD